MNRQQIYFYFLISIHAFTKDELCKIRTAKDVHALKLFLKTLLTLQSVFSLNLEEKALQEMLEDSDSESHDDDDYDGEFIMM